jgi:hypothetical protein
VLRQRCDARRFKKSPIEIIARQKVAPAFEPQKLSRAFEPQKLSWVEGPARAAYGD